MDSQGIETEPATDDHQNRLSDENKRIHQATQRLC